MRAAKIAAFLLSPKSKFLFSTFVGSFLAEIMAAAVGGVKVSGRNSGGASGFPVRVVSGSG
jgi:hypothetical protein